MTSTTLGIYNAAISAVRGRGRLSSLSDLSREREECDLWYDLVLDTVQEAAFWPGCRRTSRLALLATRDSSAAWTDSDPETQFRYKYSLPNDYLRAWYLPNYETFTLSYDGDRRVLSTDAKNAVLIYAAKQPTVGHWTPGQRLATIYGLASFIAGPLTGQNELQEANVRLADTYLREAQAASLNSPAFQLEAIPPSLTARGYSDTARTHFYYPFGRTFAAARPNV